MTLDNRTSIILDTPDCVNRSILIRQYALQLNPPITSLAEIIRLLIDQELEKKTLLKK